MKKLIEVERHKTTTEIEREFRVYDEQNNLLGTYTDAQDAADSHGIKRVSYVYHNKNGGYFSPYRKANHKLRIEYEKKKHKTVSTWKEEQEVVDKTHYSTWKAMKSRCYNPKHYAYKWYGEKGVMMCEDWKNNYEAFSDWCFANGWYKGCNISRNGDVGNYEPSNCTVKSVEQNHKERDRSGTMKPVIFSNDEEELEFDSLQHAAEYFGINWPQQVSNSLRYGWKSNGYHVRYKNEEDNTPPRKNGPRNGDNS